MICAECCFGWQLFRNTLTYIKLYFRYWKIILVMLVCYLLITLYLWISVGTCFYIFISLVHFHPHSFWLFCLSVLLNVTVSLRVEMWDLYIYIPEWNIVVGLFTSSCTKSACYTSEPFFSGSAEISPFTCIVKKVFQLSSLCRDS